MGPDFVRRVNASVAPADADRSRAGVEPERLRFPWWRGPRTEAAGFTGTTWPVTSQSNQVLPGGEEFQKAKAGAAHDRGTPRCNNAGRDHSRCKSRTLPGNRSCGKT
jgi:hypothetical protein